MSGECHIGHESVMSTRYVRNPQVELRLEDNGAFLYDTDIAELYVANETATAIWDYLVEPRDEEDIVAYIEKTFCLSLRSDEIQQIREFIGQNAARKLFVIS